MASFAGPGRNSEYLVAKMGEFDRKVCLYIGVVLGCPMDLITIDPSRIPSIPGHPTKGCFTCNLMDFQIPIPPFSGAPAVTFPVPLGQF